MLVTFRLGIGKMFFTQRVVRFWNRLPRKAVTAPSPTKLKKPLDNTLRHVV